MVSWWSTPHPPGMVTKLSFEVVLFDIKNFTMQVHGLPPRFLHEDTAARIENTVETIQKEPLGRKCIIVNRYLIFQVEISVLDSIPAGFFQERDFGGERWTLFKYKKLSDFCYKCGMLSHVTGRWTIGKPEIITTMNGITLKVYGSWIRSEHYGDLLFVNPQEKENHGQAHAALDEFECQRNPQSENFLFCEMTES